MQAEMEKRHGDLTEAQDQIRRLEDQLRQTQAAKDELENGQKELQAMMKQLEESKNMEYQERARLEEEIRAKQNEVQSIYEQVWKIIKGVVSCWIKFVVEKRRNFSVCLLCHLAEWNVNNVLSLSLQFFSPKKYQWEEGNLVLSSTIIWWTQNMSYSTWQWSWQIHENFIFAFFHRVATRINQSVPLTFVLNIFIIAVGNSSYK